MKEEKIKSFNKIALLEDKWDHNGQYGNLILNKITHKLQSGLDIGCGTGEFTKKLSEKVENVLGIDITPVMIYEAEKRNPGRNIEYVVKDFDELDEDIKFDCIVSIATFHHLNLDTALPKINRLLNKGGILIVLDLYERKGIVDLVLDSIAVPTSYILKRIKTGSMKVNPEETEAWREHSKIDTYMTFKELKEVYEKHLNQELELKRLLFWRYIMVYRKKA